MDFTPSAKVTELSGRVTEFMVLRIEMAVKPHGAVAAAVTKA